MAGELATDETAVTALPREHALRRMRRAFANPAFRFYFAGQAISQIGSWMQRIAQAWLLLDLTGSPASLGLLALVQFGPSLVISLFAGVVADQLPRRRMLLATQAVSLVQAAIVAALTLTHTIAVWEVYALALVMGVVAAIDVPTRQAFLSDLVAPVELTSAVGLNSAAFNGSRIVGPAIGGVVIAVAGVGWCFAANAFSYIPSIVVLLLIRPAYARPTGPLRRALLRDLMSGLRYARGDPALLRALVAIGVIGLFGFNWTVVIPLLARFKFDVDSVGFGAMNSSLGIGSLIGAVTVAARTAPSVGTLVAVGATLGVALIALGLAPIYPLALALLVIAGLLGIGFTASTQALLQLSSRPEYRGRVMSMYFFLIAGSTPFGGPFTAALAERFDIAAAIAIEGVLCIAGMAVVWRLRPRG